MSSVQHCEISITPMQLCVVVFLNSFPTVLSVHHCRFLFHLLNCYPIVATVRDCQVSIPLCHLWVGATSFSICWIAIPLYHLCVIVKFLSHCAIIAPLPLPFPLAASKHDNALHHRGQKHGQQQLFLFLPRKAQNLAIATRRRLPLQTTQSTTNWTTKTTQTILFFPWMMTFKQSINRFVSGQNLFMNCFTLVAIPLSISEKKKIWRTDVVFQISAVSIWWTTMVFQISAITNNYSLIPISIFISIYNHSPPATTSIIPSAPIHLPLHLQPSPRSHPFWAAAQSWGPNPRLKAQILASRPKS